MRVRRCTHVVLEPRESVSFDIAALLRGRAAADSRFEWVAFASHLDGPVAVDEAARDLLGSISARRWSERPQPDPHAATVSALVECGLLLADTTGHDGMRDRDETMRDANWWSLTAIAHRHSRWAGVDSVSDMRAQGLDTATGLRATLGPPPPSVLPLAGLYQPLPQQGADAFDQLLANRATCRNFDQDKPLELPLLAQLLQRTVMAHAEVRIDPETVFLKKNVPSGGGLHPTETWLLALRVEGLAPGFYHYHPVQHALLPRPSPAPETLAELARRMLSGQEWFADAPALLILAPRFERSFWKYRNHAKAYRAVLLDVGHISQAIYTSATAAGLASFVTAAINEEEVDRALGVDGAGQGAVAICGVGWRAAEQVTAEFDPPRHRPG